MNNQDSKGCDLKRLEDGVCFIQSKVFIYHLTFFFFPFFGDGITGNTAVYLPGLQEALLSCHRNTRKTEKTTSPSPTPDTVSTQHNRSCTCVYQVSLVRFEVTVDDAVVVEILQSQDGLCEVHPGHIHRQRSHVLQQGGAVSPYGRAIVSDMLAEHPKKKQKETAADLRRTP